MDSIFFYLRGYLKIQARGKEVMRFLNLCRARGISLRRLDCREDGCVEAVMSAEDFKKLPDIRRKTGVHIKILTKIGLPFRVKTSLRHQAFLLGILAAALLVALLTSRIWSIEVDGNVKNSTPDILEFLKEEGILPGMARSQINCSDIAASVRAAYPEMAWVSARLQGTRLLLTIKEGAAVLDTDMEEEEPCSLSSGLTGTIVRMVTRSGTPLKKPGDTCEKGEELVRGSVDIVNDDGEVTRTEYVHADADIYVEHEVAYYREFPLAYETQEADGDSSLAFYIKAGSWYLETPYFFHFSIEYKNDSIEQEEILSREYSLPEVFHWLDGFSFGIRTLQPLKSVSATYSAEEAREKALQNLERYEKQLMEEGMEISDNQVQIQVTETSCVSRGSLKVIEMTGIETGVELVTSEKAE
jgi:similar to stage IV sporulation protein